MSTNWLRLWHDMPTDPKWRTIARASKQRIGDVMAVFLHVLVCASNASERGRTQSMCSEDIASALDLETEQVEAILQAMQGRVLDGDRVRGWEKRQPNREDGSAERAKAWRESNKRAKKGQENAGQTQANASERTPNAPDTDTDTDTERAKAGAARAEGAGADVPEAPAPAAEQPAPTLSGETCRRLVKLGMFPVNPEHPALLDLLRDGATPDAIEATARELMARGGVPRFQLLLATVRGRMEDVAAGIKTGRQIRAGPARASIATPLPAPGSYGPSDIPEDWPAEVAQ